MTTTDRSDISSTDRGDATELAILRRIALLFLACAVCFFPMIFNPVIFGFFDAATDAERLQHVDENFTALRLLFTGLGVTEVALGVALWLWGNRVSAATPGRRGTVARSFAWVGLVAGVVWLVARSTVWLQDAEQFASDDLSVIDILGGLMGGGGFSLSFIVFGYLMIRGAMPTWLGVVWVFCGLMFWLGILPLWFFVAALVFGIRGLLRFRPGRSTADAVGARRTG